MYLKAPIHHQLLLHNHGDCTNTSIIGFGRTLVMRLWNHQLSHVVHPVKMSRGVACIANVLALVLWRAWDQERRGKERRG